MINDILIEYEDKLCDDEKELIREFYHQTHDKNAAVILCERIFASGYSKAFGKMSETTRIAVQNYIDIYQIGQMTGMSVKYIESLPADIQESLLECLYSTKDMGYVMKKLLEILDLKTEKTEKLAKNAEQAKPEQPEKKAKPSKKKSTSKANPKVKEQDKPSLLERLKHYQDFINSRKG